jgi:hypothetical protein
MNETREQAAKSKTGNGEVAAEVKVEKAAEVVVEIRVEKKAEERADPPPA